MRDPRRLACLASLLILVVGSVLLLVVVFKELDHGFSDDPCGPPPPGQELIWAAQVMVLLGIGGLISILVSRRVRARGWIALGLTAAVAIAVPAVRTDWDGWRAQRSFEAAAAPHGWQPACTRATVWQDEHGIRVGESFQRDYFVYANNPVADRAAIVDHYNRELRGANCAAPANGYLLICRDQRRELTLRGTATRASLTVTSCRNGGDPTNRTVLGGQMRCAASRSDNSP